MSGGGFNGGRRGGRGGGSRTCFKCGEEGHISRNCPTGGGGGRGGYRGGRGRWELSSSSTSSGHVAAPIATKTAEEVINYWSNNDAVRLPSPPPLKYEPPETDFHLQVMEEQRLWRESRKLIIGFNGSVLTDCRGTHTTVDDMCMFCDGRRGPWAMKNPPVDPVFRRYQENLIASREKYAGGGRNANQPREEGPNLAQLVPEEEAGALFDDQEFGLQANPNAVVDDEEFGY